MQGTVSQSPVDTGPRSSTPVEGTGTPVRPRAPAGGPPTLLYIVGHHKSGSTVLGAMIAGSPDVFFGGELYRFPHPIWTPGDPARKCSCGQPALSCRFWSDVRAQFEPKHPLAEFRAGQLRWESWGALFRTVLARGSARADLSRHATAMEDLLAILSKTSGSGVIVESSFSALRGWIYRLHGSSRISVKYLHLVRDGRAFLWSEMRNKDVPEEGGWWIRLPPLVVARWTLMNLLAFLLCSRDRDRYLRVRYEDLVTDPRGTLERVGRFAGVDLSDVISRLESRTPIPLRHVAAGSFHRLEGAIVLRPDFRWRTDLPRATRILFWVTSGWLARLLGYRRASGA